MKALTFLNSNIIEQFKSAMIDNQGKFLHVVFIEVHMHSNKPPKKTTSLTKPLFIPGWPKNRISSKKCALLFLLKWGRPQKFHKNMFSSSKGNTGQCTLTAGAQ